MNVSQIDLSAKRKINFIWKKIRTWMIWVAVSKYWCTDYILNVSMVVSINIAWTNRHISLCDLIVSYIDNPIYLWSLSNDNSALIHVYNILVKSSFQELVYMSYKLKHELPLQFWFFRCQNNKFIYMTIHNIM